MSQNYEAGQVGIRWQGIDLTAGLAPDSFLSIEPLENRKSFTFGTDSRKVSSKMANKGATITATYLQTSETNKKIAQIAAAEDAIGAPTIVSDFEITDDTGQSVTFIVLGAELETTAASNWGAEVGERTWSWVCELYLQSDDPATLTAALSTYIK